MCRWSIIRRELEVRFCPASLGDRSLFAGQKDAKPQLHRTAALEVGPHSGVALGYPCRDAKKCKPPVAVQRNRRLLPTCGCERLDHQHLPWRASLPLFATAARLVLGASLNFHQLHEEVLHVSTTFCKLIDEGDDHFAEWGIGPRDRHKAARVADQANVRPTFNGFKKMDYEMYRYICGVPILYAASLTKERGDKA